MTVTRYKSDIISIGTLTMGGDLPVRLQSMTNTDTLDTAASVSQCIRIIEAGGELVRLTAQGVREAENLAAIRNGLRAAGFDTPLCADIHFNPAAAETAARIVEKVRINPGNYADKRASFIRQELTEGEWMAELERTRERVLPLIKICKEYGTAVRIGVNHGSLSDRIMTRYGNTPMGMVVSAIEFLKIFTDEGFHRIVVSMKSSDTLTMVTANRLLVRMMAEEGMFFPVHLGITEAGEGEDGRIISAAGTGTLLAEGIGDTVRVSLSEPPEAEIPVARAIVNAVAGEAGRVMNSVPPLEQQRAGERWLPQVYTLVADKIPEGTSGRSGHGDDPGDKNIPGDGITDKGGPAEKPVKFADESGTLFSGETLTISPDELRLMTGMQAFDRLLNPVFSCDDPEQLAIEAATLLGRFFIARHPAGLSISNNGSVQGETLRRVAFSILQATEARITRTRYISCPTCGRTKFNLQEAVQKVKAATAHLTGMKIAVMGCVVNGPGEMAGADYGYVGAAEGRVHIYRGTEPVYKNVPEAEALDRLLELISSDQAGRKSG
ncbi:MAG: (E)-4-hydroxy-3-methylbut-2-enyl-diphosphate synthase [Bacteroidales bacterium]|jgi:(E)-4-hydroxy-3-methylbut-2-enyl-diphosphate synthase|nr:(E)-4-hydroxy-3-methylbut-2-enyl-diphosphate synthase [Bacteroidales bacterium]MCB9029021.1 (E)-4-hydroxy-3-methylbut-2-enyl-diphosphate synthase [Bacteroidales bacterium]HOO67634.1 (E)-4-hydroxy-3-methylbut-2-enyl-diphosphate synthase [Bacteroidales bacterium]HPE23583.1 (E)-4-hydroxy-3-methylbut-2-enyl-diphosphate synthase [Bacteroidales bacterium]HPJ06241.1 (E)-4-hydroxy-3-methylbut-2-enyl-diphosphate synthase [Bacteroidales bacterium]